MGRPEDHRFGFGLSYTAFEQPPDSVDVGRDEITVKATVKKTGDNCHDAQNNILAAQG